MSPSLIKYVLGAGSELKPANLRYHKFTSPSYSTLFCRSYTIALLFQKRSIYIDTVNWNINIFMQSGLTVKWRRSREHYFKLEAALKSRRLVQSTKVKINLEHLLGAFFLLLSGTVLSAFVLLLEKYYFRKSCGKVQSLEWQMGPSAARGSSTRASQFRRGESQPKLKKLLATA